MSGPQGEAKLRRFADLLQEMAIPAGFVARSDAGKVSERHIADSLRAGQAFRPADELAYDLGSGAGLPGIPLAIAFPSIRFVLAESRRRRVGFLELVVERLNLPNVQVHAGRVEELPSGADLATARAFAPLAGAWAAARPLLVQGGRLVYFAGAGMEDPLEAARVVGGEEAEASLLAPLASHSPLVIMTRK